MTIHISPITRFSTNELPIPVTQVIGWLQELDVWHLLSRNDKARSCRDAANKRHRLGSIGITLEDINILEDFTF